MQYGTINVSLEYGLLVASEMGHGWAAERRFCADGTPRAGVYLTDGAVCLHVGESWDARGRITVSGVRPEGTSGVYESAEDRALKDTITVAADTTPERCAHAITRRLLPEWGQRNAKLATLVVARQTHAARVLAEAQEVARITGARMEDIRNTTDLGEVRLWGPAGLTLRVYGSGVVALERFECSLRDLAAVVAAVA